MTLRTLAEVSELIEKHLPAETRAKSTWLHVETELKKAAAGADLRGVPEAYRAHPMLQKPFRAEALERALQAVAPKPASA